VGLSLALPGAATFALSRTRSTLLSAVPTVRVFFPPSNVSHWFLASVPDQHVMKKKIPAHLQIKVQHFHNQSVTYTNRNGSAIATAFQPGQRRTIDTYSCEGTSVLLGWYSG
jgi:hypothetical protein